MSRMDTHASPLQIVVCGFSSRNQALITQLFAGPDWNDCAIVGTGPVDLGIVDLDTPSPERTWRDYRNKYAEVPTIIVALQEQQRDNAYYLKKPINPAALRKFIDKLSQRSTGSKRAAAHSRAEPVTLLDSVRNQHQKRALISAPKPPELRPVRASARAAATELNRDIRELNCGSSADLDLTDASIRAQLTYDPARCFQRVLERAIADARRSGTAQEICGQLPARLRIVPGAAVTIESALKTSFLRVVSTHELQSVSMRIVPSPDPIPAATRTDAAVLLWQIALWTARGRLPVTIKPDTPVRLRQWPNFTRIAETPHAMQIASILTKSTLSAIDLCDRLKIPQRFVFSFLSAAHANGLVELAPRADVRPQVAVTRSPLRGLLKRILGRLSVSEAA